MSFRPISGECYRNAFLWAQDNPGWDIVHGIVWNPVIKAEMGHAWNEKDGIAYDPSADMSMPSALYYALGKISYVKHYTMIQAAILAVKENTYGAWDSKIIASRHRQRKKMNKKNPSVLSRVMKNKAMRKHYDRIRNFYFDQYMYSLSPRVAAHAKNLWKIQGPKTNILILQPTPEIDRLIICSYPSKHLKKSKFAGHVQQMKNELGEEILVFTVMPPVAPKDYQEAALGLETIEAIIKHEFIHILQFASDQKFASGRRKKDAVDPNLKVEHKSYLEDIWHGVDFGFIFQTCQTPMKLIKKSDFKNYMVDVINHMIDLGLDQEHRRLILTDIFRMIKKLSKSMSKGKLKKLRKAGLPI